MNKQQLVQELTSRLNAKKASVVSDVRFSVASYIEGQKRGCLTLVHRLIRCRQGSVVRRTMGYVAPRVCFTSCRNYDIITNAR